MLVFLASFACVQNDLAERRVVSEAVAKSLQEMQRRVPVDEGDLESTCQKLDYGSGHGMLVAGKFPGL